MTDIEVKIQEKIDEYIGGILAKEQITHDDYRVLRDHISSLRMDRMTSAMACGFNLAQTNVGGDVA